MPGERIHQLLDDGQIAVRLDYKHLPDLDDLMLRIWQEVEPDNRYGNVVDGDDDPTRFHSEPEPVWEWTKISPCWCGEHGWHWDSRRVPDDRDLLEDRPKGKFVSIQWY